MEHTEILEKLCQEKEGNRNGKWNATLLKGEGSNRKYYRMTAVDNGNSYIGVEGENEQEDIAFVSISRHLHSMGLPVPEVYGTSDDCLCYLQQDLGDTSLFSFMKNGIETGTFSETEKNMLNKVMKLLPSIQFKGDKDMDYSICYPIPEFDQRSILWDLNYFKYCFLKSVKIDFSEPKLEIDFEQMANNLLGVSQNAWGFMYRDFQSRNIMINNGEPYAIDFQGGRRGPCLYDVASFVWQAKANYPQSLKEGLVDTYYDALQQYVKMDRKTFDNTLGLFVLFRTIQVLGAYGYRGLFERKPHFMASIPFAINNLKGLLDKGLCHPYPYMESLLGRLCSLPELQPLAASKYDTGKLTVKVFSFSYKKGIPADDSGNGGGYVFDCRGVHNPGKYEQYKQLTGRDQPVKDFLEKDGEILTFLNHVYALADAHVQRYIERGFSSLMFSFGCTGGQHRSVYSAQHVAEHIAKKFGVKVLLCHQAQGINEEFN